ncbi:recombinase family protein [Kitasatospora griseola]|uniref:recombinase family protein n=1 Tax=Kitasatospora griseola TaxID=2064 RepID=UPI0036DF156A
MSDRNPRTPGPPAPSLPAAPAAKPIRIGYARCSTAQQELASRLTALEPVCKRIFSEKISTRIKNRLELEKALKPAYDITIRTGRNVGTHPSVASLYRALAEAEDVAGSDDAQVIGRRPVHARITGPGTAARAGPERRQVGNTARSISPGFPVPQLLTPGEAREFAGPDTVGVMRAEGTTPEPETTMQSGLRSPGEAACRYQADEIRPEDLPMIAAEALAAELDTPTLCELAGWPRNADARDIRDAIEQALAESGIRLPDRGLARRHAPRRMAARFIDGETTPADLAADGWWETDVETAAEQP